MVNADAEVRKPTRTMTPPASAYSLKDVGVTLPVSSGRVDVLRGVSFAVAQGEFVAIVGPSGSGKTTLVRVLSGLLRASSGEVSAGGNLVTGVPEGVVTVFQDYAQALLPWRSVRRNVEIGLEGKLGRAERRSIVDAVLRMVHLEDKRDEYPWRLSGGMQQRVQIARALALEPSVLLMDEPFGSLDALTKAKLQDELLQVHTRTAATIVFVTHDIDEAIYVSDRVLVLTGVPARISLDVCSGLPRPRDQLTTRADPAFLRARAQITEALGLG